MDRIAITRRTLHTDGLRVSVAREAAGIFQQPRDGLILSHFVEHRTLHLAGDTHDAVVSTNLNDIVVLQHHVACQTTVQNELVHIHHRNDASMTRHLDVTQCSELLDAARHVEGMEDSGKGRQAIGARGYHFTHHVHQDRTRLSDGHLDVGAGITRT